MKPKDLKSPFSWEERRVMIQDRVWFVPDFMDTYTTFRFQGWEAPELFGNVNPVKVEYCSGNGDWIAKRAEAEPDCNWVAVERKFDRVRKIWAKIKNWNLKNMIVLCGDGALATEQYFPDRSLDAVHINFPDPWPKERHKKHRIIQPSFIHDLQRVLRPQACVTFVTDDADYSDWTIDLFAQHEGFASNYKTPYYETDVTGYGYSWFDSLWRSKGRQVRYHQFKRNQ